MSLVHLSSSVLPGDASVRRFNATERLSQPYEIDVEFATADYSFEVGECLRARAVVSLTDEKGRLRHFDGFIDRASFVAHTGTTLHFHLRLVPLLAQLAHREGSRIFQGSSVVDIIKLLLSEAGIDERVDWRLRGEHPEREFVVQYRETELNFLHRWLEDLGIFYFFEHSTEGHTLVFADHPEAFVEQPNLEQVHFGMVQGLAEATDPLETFSREHRLRPTNVLLRDFDYRQPQVKPEAAASAAGPVLIQHYGYPGRFDHTDKQAEPRARARLRSLRRDADVTEGESGALGLCPGVPFTVQGASEAACNGEFVLTEVLTRGEQGEESEEGEGGNFACRNTFKAVPKGIDFAPPIAARRPKIRGVQTAIVTGPSNEPQSIHVDKFGRVKVRFHWDRAGIGDDKSSCWLRVAQTGLGASMTLPRVGWELAIAFADGDPDRPMAVGRLYNGKQKPMFDVAGGATEGAFKSMSSPGGAGSNSMGTVDSGGSQGFNMSAQKDMNAFVGADKTETVAVDEDLKVGSNLSSTVAGSETWVIGGSQAVTVGNALQNKTGGAQSIVVGGSETTGTVANYIEAVGSREYSIGGTRTTISNGVRTLVSGAVTRSVGAVQAVIAAGPINDALASTYDETVGAVKAELIAGDSDETVAGAKMLSNSAAELHVVTNLNWKAASVTRMIGGVHLRKVGGNLEVSAPQIAIVGGVGHFTGGGSSLKLNGGPITATGPTISIKSALIKKTAGSIKLE